MNFSSIFRNFFRKPIIGIFYFYELSTMVQSEFIGRTYFEGYNILKFAVLSTYLFYFYADYLFHKISRKSRYQLRYLHFKTRLNSI